MSKILEISWWLSYSLTALPWWLFCVLCSVAALPLSMRLFRGLADRGAGLSTGLGLVASNFIGWVFALGWFDLSSETGRKLTMLRLLLLALASGAFALATWWSIKGLLEGRARLLAYLPAVILAAMGLLHIPHSFISAWLGLLVVASLSLAVWADDLVGFKRALKVGLVPFLISQVLFLIAFLFFLNVRSYIPYATFERSLWQAEKWGNFTHLNSIMTSSAMPPRDLWFNNHPINYYYGGHLLVATIAKATFTGAGKAFNLGLATVFALTFTLGFSFTLSLVHLTTRRMRLGPVRWHFGLGWALLGALAISCFGNLDPWRQFFTRKPMETSEVRYKLELDRRRAGEEWKLETGVGAQTARLALAHTNSVASFDKARALAGEFQRLSALPNRAPEELRALADRIDAETAKARTPQQLENSLLQILRDGAVKRAFEEQNSVSALDLEATVYNAIFDREYEKISPAIRAAADGQRDVSAEHQKVSARIEQGIEDALASDSIRELLEVLQDSSIADSFRKLARADARDGASNLEAAIAAKDFPEAGRLVDSWWNSVRTQTANADGLRNLNIPDAQRSRIAGALSGALAALSYDGREAAIAVWGSAPPEDPTRIDEGNARFSWANYSYVDFWQPSRAIKSSPPGVNEPGTITEFPYFSAILGDLHPHHMALPFTLLALCACLSLLRKNSRLISSDCRFFRRGAPELAMMAFMIGAVFPVNIWDSVVLAPLYAIVIIVAMAGTRTCECWRWVGFAGFMVLLAMVCGILYNSVPGVLPLFENMKFFLLAVIVAAFAPVAAARVLPMFTESAWFLIAAAVGTLIVLVGGVMAPSTGAYGLGSQLGIGFRDACLFLVLLLIASSWTLKGAPNVQRWWYSAGGAFALVGAASLLVILPFKLFFHSPLEPQGEIFANLLPPILSWELTHATDGFWRAFWRGSPVNPFPENLRSEMRDFIAHWGIFFLPIFCLAVGRFFKAAKEQPAGVPFMILGLVVGVMAFTRNYLGPYWVGPMSLGMVILCIYYALTFKRRAESAAWTFLAAAFFWTWFVEALHFDDDYAGHYERYNTPFKIFYPLWPIFAGGMVVALREMFARFPVRERCGRELAYSSDFWIVAVMFGFVVPWAAGKLFGGYVATLVALCIWIPAAVAVLFLVFDVLGLAHRVRVTLNAEVSRAVVNWPAWIAAAVVLFAGMIYPIAATMTRTRHFFTDPVAGAPVMMAGHRDIFRVRTLDALAHYRSFDSYRQDYKVMNWIRENVPSGAFVLELPGDHAYSQEGRISSGAGRPTILGWRHHEQQWRGRAKPASKEFRQEYYDEARVPLPLLGTLFEQQAGDVVQNVMDRPPVNLGDDATHADRRAQINANSARLRNADGKGRRALLRALIPEAAPSDIERLQRIIEKNDFTMNSVADILYNDAAAMYQSTNAGEFTRLAGRYGIDYVVVGELERMKYGREVSARLFSFGLETVYDSAADLLPEEKNPFHGAVEGAPETTISGPTVVMKVPDTMKGAE